jgi:putative membrane protein
VKVIKYLALSWAANAIVLAVVAIVLPGVTFGGIHGIGNLLTAAALFGVLNTFLKPFLRLLTLPLLPITLGLIWFFVSMLMLWLTSWIVNGFAIDGFWNLVWSTIIVWLVNIVLDYVGPWRATRRD